MSGPARSGFDPQGVFMKRFWVVVCVAVLSVFATAWASQGDVPSLDHIKRILRQVRSRGWYEVWRVGEKDMFLGGGKINFSIRSVDLKTDKASRRPIKVIDGPLWLGYSYGIAKPRGWFKNHGMKVEATSSSTGEKLFEQNFPLYPSEPVAVRLMAKDDGTVAPVYEIVVSASAPANPIPVEAVVFTRLSPGPTTLFGVGTVFKSGGRAHIHLPAGTYSVRVRWLDQWTSDDAQTVTVGEGMPIPTLSFDRN